MELDLQGRSVTLEAQTQRYKFLQDGNPCPSLSRRAINWTTAAPASHCHASAWSSMNNMRGSACVPAEISHTSQQKRALESTGNEERKKILVSPHDLNRCLPL